MLLIGAFSSVQYPHSGVEPCGQTEPQKIGNVQLSCHRTYFAKSKNHPHHQRYQQQQPKEGIAPDLPAEKENAPPEVYEKLRTEHEHGVAPLSVATEPHQCGGDAHQNIEDRPHDGKGRRRRRESRFLQVFKGSHALPAEKRRQCARNQWDGNEKNKGFPISFKQCKTSFSLWYYIVQTRKLYGVF